MKSAAAILLLILVAAQNQSEEVGSLLTTYDNIKHLHEYSGFYRSLFAACGPSELVRLTTNVNDSIATQSAWETVEMTVPKEDGRKVYRPDSTRLAWFVGFFEGRNRVIAPDWWRTVVTDARANRRHNIYSGKPKEHPYHRTKIDNVSCPADATVTEIDGVVTYHVGDNSVVIPEELIDRGDGGDLWQNISCTFTREQCFAAVHGDGGYSHNISCLDRKTGGIVWQAKACGCWWGGSTGRSESWVTVVPTDDGRVFVFGAASIGFYAHGFDAKSGNTLVQFSNNY